MIELVDVTKMYDGKVIFEDVNLQVDEGTVTAFIGHNGCGKSTMLKVLSGLTKIEQGEVRYDKKYRFAYVPDKFIAVNMTAKAYLKHMADIDGRFSKAERQRRIEQLAQEFFLESMLEKPMKKLSKGTLQKIGVIQALMSEPEILLLDEPLSGQDADSQAVFIQKIEEMKRKGTTVLLSAHEMDLVRTLGDRIYTIQNQKVEEYIEKQNSQYVIWVQAEEGRKPLENMMQMENGYCIYTNESMLASEIGSLLRKGWHISKVYENGEDCKL